MAYTNHNKLAHAWTQREVMPDKELRGYSMFCTHDTIYSWGYHFPIARWHGEDTVFFNADSYSKSTGRHKSIVRWALRRARPSVQVFTLPHACWNGEHTLSLLFYKDKIESTVGKWRRARRYKDWHMRDAHAYLAEFRRYCAFHKLNLHRHILSRDGQLAAACAVIALNPVPETDY